MTDSEIEGLKYHVRRGDTVIWWPDEKTAMQLTRVGPPPIPIGENEIAEPSECAYFAKGYAALYNADSDEFFIATKIF